MLRVLPIIVNWDILMGLQIFLYGMLHGVLRNAGDMSEEETDLLEYSETEEVYRI